MKNILRPATLLCALLCLLLPLHAQEHQDLIYERIPMKGGVESFAMKLVHQGYSLNKTYTRNGIGYAELTVRRNKETLSVSVATNERQSVHSVTVRHPERRQWQDLINDYTDTAKRMQDAYGDPVDTIQGDPSASFAELADNITQFRQTFRAPGGTVSVEILTTRKYGQVQESYTASTQ